MFSSALRRSIVVVLLTAAITHESGFPNLKLKLDRRASYNFSNSNGRRPECPICVGSPPRCNGSLLLKGASSATVQFKCQRPEDTVHVEIRRDIACTAQSCDGDVVVEEPSALEGVSRTLVWSLKAPQAFLIDFAGSGLRQIDSSQACPDQNTYTLWAVGDVDIGTYCRTGPIAEVQVLSQGAFSLRVPAKKKLHAGRFNVTVGAMIASLAKIKVVLSAGDSAPVELFSPNYPQSFPDDDLVKWDFRVPAMHNATVRVVNHTLPACRKKRTSVEYHHSGGRSGVVLGLADPQPTVQHSFNMTLKNCEMDGARRTPQGLSLRFRVTSVPSSLPVSCTVDLRKERGLSLTLEKARPGSKCEMRVGATAKTKVVVTSNSIAQLSFRDCSPDDVWVMASRVIECPQLKKCPKMPFPLQVPALPACLPVPLRSVTWSLVLPAEGSLALLCPGDGLRQTLPDQNCDGSTVIAIAEDSGRASVGRFCSRGPIQSIQVRTNVSVTASGDRGLPQSLPVLSAHFKGEIAERYIFTVSPKVNETTRLASPGWPAGMKSQATVSWIVNVPAKKEAHLAFVNLSRPLKCSDRHSNIRVQLLGSLEEMYSRREDEDAEMQQVVPGSFYLNMSNCMPEKGQLSVVTEITLRKSRNLLLTIILSVVSVLLVLAALVLTVVCVVIRKKKKEMNRNQVSIYNPAGTVFRPGESHLPGSDEDEYHVYASIEDTLVYTHLLKKELEVEGDDDKADTYRPFTGPTEPPRPLSSMNPEVGTYRPFPGTPNVGPPVPQANRPPSRDQTMVHNGLYDPDGQSDLGVSEDDVSGPPALGARMEPEGSD